MQEEGCQAEGGGLSGQGTEPFQAPGRGEVPLMLLGLLRGLTPLSYPNSWWDGQSQDGN